MKRVYLISCCKKKGLNECEARKLYQGVLFKKSLEYTNKMYADHVFILSAEYGLLSLDDVVAPYDKTLRKMRKADKKQWSLDVIVKLSKYFDLKNDEFVILAGKDYREYLVDSLSNCYIPLEGLGIGKQLKKLNEAIEYGSSM